MIGSRKLVVIIDKNAIIYITSSILVGLVC